MTTPPQPLPLHLLNRIVAGDTLPEPLPAEPFTLFKEWFDEAAASRNVPNPNAMTLATVEPDGSPSARIVLCRGISVADGWIEFFTNYKGGKGRALEANPVASAVFHFDHLDRQVRISGSVTRSPAESSDQYFASRAWESRLSAWASQQSHPLASRAELVERIPLVMKELGITAADIEAQGNATPIPRPRHWGGFRILAAKCELWVGGPGRLHDRAVWTRPAPFSADGWSVTRLNP